MIEVRDTKKSIDCFKRKNSQIHPLDPTGGYGYRKIAEALYIEVLDRSRVDQGEEFDPYPSLSYLALWGHQLQPTFIRQALRICLICIPNNSGSHLSTDNYLGARKAFCDLQRWCSSIYHTWQFRDSMTFQDMCRRSSEIHLKATPFL